MLRFVMAGGIFASRGTVATPCDIYRCVRTPAKCLACLLTGQEVEILADHSVQSVSDKMQCGKWDGRAIRPLHDASHDYNASQCLMGKQGL